MASAPRLYVGLAIHNWKVVRKMPDDKKTKSPNLRRRVKVVCNCGNEEVLPLYYLTRSNPKLSCGCLNKGLPTREKLSYNSWYMMNVRCQDEKHVAYADYGGRGIKVHPTWLKSNPHGFANFLKDMGRRPSKDLTLDRKDPNDGYHKENCRWASWDVQNNNKRMHHHITRDPIPEKDDPSLDISTVNDEEE